MASMLDMLAGTSDTITPISSGATSVAVPTPPTALKGANVALIPYNAVYDPQAADFLAWMWRRMQQDDLVDYYFPGQKETGYATFVRMMSGDAQVGIVKAATDSTQWDDIIAGFISWTPLTLGTRKMAVAGLVFFKKFWGHKVADEAGAMALRYWFEDTDVESVLGVCPEPHHLISRYNERMGLHKCGTLKGAHVFRGSSCNATLWELTKDEWLKGGR